MCEKDSCAEGEALVHFTWWATGGGAVAGGVGIAVANVVNVEGLHKEVEELLTCGGGRVLWECIWGKGCECSVSLLDGVLV